MTSARFAAEMSDGRQMIARRLHCALPEAPLNPPAQSTADAFVFAVPIAAVTIAWLGTWMPSGVVPLSVAETTRYCVAAVETPVVAVARTLPPLAAQTLLPPPWLIPRNSFEASPIAAIYPVPVCEPVKAPTTINV